MRVNQFSKFLLYAAILSMIVSCATVDYVGETYPASENVQVYFSLDEVSREYRVFGHIVGSGGIFTTENDRLEKLKIEAMNRGADAIVITGIDIENGDDLEETKKINASLIKYID